MKQTKAKGRYLIIPDDYQWTGPFLCDNVEPYIKLVKMGLTPMRIGLKIFDVAEGRKFKSKRTNTIRKTKDVFHSWDTHGDRHPTSQLYAYCWVPIGGQEEADHWSRVLEHRQKVGGLKTFAQAEAEINIQ